MPLRTACGIQLSLSALLVAALALASALFDACPWGRAAVVVGASALVAVVGVHLTVTPAGGVSPAPARWWRLSLEALAWSPAVVLALLLFVPSLFVSSLWGLPDGIWVLLVPVVLPLGAVGGSALAGLVPPPVRKLLGWFS
jgi:hypothetical protein